MSQEWPRETFPLASRMLRGGKAIDHLPSFDAVLGFRVMRPIDALATFAQGERPLVLPLFVWRVIGDA
jgi:hypothetical protein